MSTPPELTTIALSNTDVTLTAAQAAVNVLVLTGNLTANVNVIVPANPGQRWAVINQTTGAFTATLTTGSGLGWIAHGTDDILCTSAGIVSMSRGLAARDFGAVGDNTTDNLTVINQALQLASLLDIKEIVLDEGHYLISAAPTNPAGVQFVGPGALVTPDPSFTGYTRQLNSYTDMGYAINREHLYRAYARLFLGPASAISPLAIYTYGDSTVANYVASNTLDGQYFTEALIPEMLLSRGLNATVTNRSVAGTHWDQLNAIADVGAADLMIIKYGINDAIGPVATRLQTMATNMRTRLAAIRAATNGSVATLSIIVMGPNATVDPANNRDEQWYEQLRSLYIDVCNEYGCAYFDTYAWLKDLRQGAGGNWMDLVSGVMVHPLDIGKDWQFGGVIDAFFPFAQIERYRTNRFISTGVNMGAATYATPPGGYRIGQTLQTAQHASGWPYDGAVLTVQSVDGYAIQFNYNYAQATGNQPALVVRTGTTGSWGPWSGQAQALSLANGWTAVGGYSAPRATRSADGAVRVTGLVAGGVTVNGTLMATLPAGMWPDAQRVYRVANSGASGNTNVVIGTDGGIRILNGGDAAYTSLDGICF